MSVVFTSAVAHSLKKTLNKIIDDKLDGFEQNLVLKKWCVEETMEDAFVDDLEMSGIGLTELVTEGQELPSGSIQEGYVTRYIARKYGKKIQITDEAMEDCKYDQVISAAKRLKRAAYKTLDIDATNIWVRATNTSYNGGDGLPLASASHTVATGGTFSNTLSTPMAPSRAAWIIVRSAVKKQVGHDGLIEGYDIDKIVCPTEQWAVWAGIVGSTHAPEPGAFNEINVVNEHHSRQDVIDIKYWTNTTTNWGVLTDCDGGPRIKWRRKFKTNTWVADSQEIMNHSISGRYARLWSDPRSVYFSNA